MNEEPERKRGFVPGRHAVEAYGVGGFQFAGMSHVGSILISPRGVLAVETLEAASLTAELLDPLFEELNARPRSIEFLVIGTGSKLTPPPKLFLDRLRSAGLRFEVMSTGAATRVYNVTMDEGRRVAALLLAAV